MYHKLFRPLQIGPREIPNRILFGSHPTNLARHNLLSAEHATYYAARARGGAGLLVLEEHSVHPSDFSYESALLGYLPGTPQAIARTVQDIHAHNALALLQLNHNGQQGSSDYHQRELWAPSPVPNVATREVPKEMELADIQAVIAGFALATRHAIAGGADGVELSVADHSLLRQFLSPLTNQRGDDYGGPLEHRLRFLQETIEAVDQAIGSDHILGLRLCADELAPWAGLTPEQSLEIARHLTSTGRIDYMTITMGSIFSTHMFPFHASMRVPPGYAARLAAALKKMLTIPIFAAGRIMSADQAEQLLAEEQADGVEMIRALIADPNLPALAREGQSERVRPCLACNQGCQVRSVLNAPISCNVNPNLSDSPSLTPARTAQPLTVWIIGGGPAGMEAARAAALRGQHVILYERSDTLGGAAALAARGVGRSELRAITEYLQAELTRLNVTIQTGSEVTAERILAQRPNAVIVATGAQSAPGLLTIPGHDLPHVIDVRHVVRGELVPGPRVLIFDECGSHAVASAVELLAEAGKQVEVVTEDWYTGRDLVPTHDMTHWLQRVLALGVTLTTHTSLVRIEPGQVVLCDRFAEGEITRPVDSVVLGTYERPNQDLYLQLKGKIARLFRAGDCIAPRRIEQAITEGRHAGEQV